MKKLVLLVLAILYIAIPQNVTAQQQSKKSVYIVMQNGDSVFYELSKIKFGFCDRAVKPVTDSLTSDQILDMTNKLTNKAGWLCQKFESQAPGFTTWSNVPLSACEAKNTDYWNINGTGVSYSCDSVTIIDNFKWELSYNGKQIFVTQTQGKTTFNLLLLTNTAFQVEFDGVGNGYKYRSTYKLAK